MYYGSTLQMMIMRLVIISFAISRIENGEIVNDTSREVDVSATPAVKKFKEIVKSPRDIRSYRGLQLTNDLKVMLISDSSTNISAACLTVGIGAIDDFPDAPGLANLVGHVLVNGNVMRHRFDKFLANRGGKLQTPVTKPDTQQFSFSIKSADFKVALEKFVQFFLEPELNLATNTPASEIIDLIQEDFEKRAKIDDVRIKHVEMLIGRENHPYTRLRNGNKETFVQQVKNFLSAPRNKKPASIYDKVQKFYSMWYSSNIMTLAVLGKETLDELEELVVPLFEKLRNKQRERLIYPFENHPLGPEQLKNKIYILPLKDVQMLRLNFPTPFVRNRYRTSPDFYVGKLLVNEEPGGLIFVLRKNSLCVSLQINYVSVAGIAFFSIQCNLSMTGVERIDDIINIIFQSIHLLRSRGVQRSIFNELQTLLDLDFLNRASTFHQKEPLLYVEYLAHAMHLYPMNDILSYPYVIDQWDQEFIEDFFSYLRPDNMNVSIVSKEFLKKTNKTDEYYKVVYGVEEIPDDLIKKWSAKEPISELQLPARNALIPDSFELYHVDENEPKDPYIIHESSISEIWFKQDREFRVPKLLITFEMYSSIPLLSPKQYILWRLFRVLLRLSLKNHMYPAKVAGYNYEIGLDNNIMRVTLYGYDNKLPVVLEMFLSKVTSFRDDNDLDEKSFKTSLQQYLKIMKQSITMDYDFQLNWYKEYIVEKETGWTVDNIINSAKELQFDDLKKFLSKVFRRIFVRGLLHGNCTKERALQIVYIIEKSFQSSSGLLLQEVLQPRAVEMTDGLQFIYRTDNQTPGVYAYISYFQFSGDLYCFKDQVAEVIFHYITQDLCHKILSDNKAHNSSVKCTVSKTFNVRGYTIEAVTKWGIYYVDAKVEKFLQTVSNLLRNLTIQELRNFKKRMENKLLLAKPKDLEGSSKYIWFEITGRSYVFNKTAMILEQLHSLKKVDLIEFYQKMFDASSPKRRKLTIYVFPKGTTKTKSLSTNVQVPNKKIEIEELEDFKTNSSLLPRGFRPVPSLSLK